MYKTTLFLLRFIALFPLWFLYGISDFIYFVIYYIIGYRRKVVWKNLTEAFPGKSPKELKRIERQYYHFMCDIIVETIKLLHISGAEISRRVEVENPDLVNASVDAGKSVVLLLGHYGNWEWVQEISKYFPDGIFKASIYRPLNSKVWNDIYKKIRNRWSSHILPQNSAVKALLNKENQPWICGFIADARPRHSEPDAVIQFLNHSTSFIYGPEMIGKKTGADFYFLEMERKSRGKYRITFHRLDPTEDGLPYPVSREFWREFEKVIEKSPAYWLWSHKRWKK